MVAFRKQKFEDHTTVTDDPVASGGHFHPFAYLGRAGGQRTGCSLDLDYTDPAPAEHGKTGDMAKTWNGNAVFARYLEDGLVVPRAEVVAIDLQRYDSGDWWAWHIYFSPAVANAASYSCRK
jgi:hypothetical protein